MKKLSTAALCVLDEGLRFDGCKVQIVQQVDRKLYEEVNAALASLGGTWTRAAKAHVFASDPAADIDAIVTAGGWVDRKKDLQQFYTPKKLAREIVERAGVRGKRVLEPSAGWGAIAVEAHEQGAAYVACVEIDPENVTALRGNGVERWGSVREMNFLQTRQPRIPYECAAMNPPFQGQQDIAHVRHAFSQLAPGGKLVAVMSAGTAFRMNATAQQFRGMVDAHGTLEELPEGSFQESGTGVRTVVVELTR